MKLPRNNLKIQNFFPIVPTEDFWSRRANARPATFEFTPLGIPARITANRPELLAAAGWSAGRFSPAQRSGSPSELPQTGGAGDRPIQIRLVVRQDDCGPVPDDLPQRLQYSGVGEWITLSAGKWGHGFASLQTREAVVVLSPALAAETGLVSRYFIDHYLLNFILADWAMLHASCVLDSGRQRLIVMIGPHNVGKSTTALHLLRAGYVFLADGMALLRWRDSRQDFVVGGYPIGEVKLRDDVLALFPEYSDGAVKGREGGKTVVNLRVTHPDRLVETPVTPSSVLLCFVERSPNSRTRVGPLTAREALPLVAANTVYWDEPARLEHNTVALQALLERAGLCRLLIGTDPKKLVAAVDGLR